MKMRKLMAIKPHKYGTRHLTAGEEYEAPPRQAVALVAARRAKFAAAKPAHAAVEKTGANAPMAPPPAAPAPSMPRYEPEPAEEAPNLDSLRLQATQLGINVDGRWGAARLQYEVEHARRR